VVWISPPWALSASACAAAVRFPWAYVKARQRTRRSSAVAYDPETHTGQSPEPSEECRHFCRDAASSARCPPQPDASRPAGPAIGFCEGMLRSYRYIAHADAMIVFHSSEIRVRTSLNTQKRFQCTQSHPLAKRSSAWSSRPRLDIECSTRRHYSPFHLASVCLRSAPGADHATTRATRKRLCVLAVSDNLS
jgi:hypothetical protein